MTVMEILHACPSLFSGMAFIAFAFTKGSFPSYSYIEVIRALWPLAMLQMNCGGLVIGTIMSLLQKHLPQVILPLAFLQDFRN